MTKEQFLEKYAKENTAVHCETEETAKEFLQLCEKFGIEWRSGYDALSSLDEWEVYKDKTCFYLNEGQFLTFASKSWYEDEDDYIIIPFEPEQKEMKKMNSAVNIDYQELGAVNIPFSQNDWDNIYGGEYTKSKENKMNKEERVKLVFETLSKIFEFEIKPNKKFYINANGKKHLYKISETLQLLYEKDNGIYETSLFNILPILNDVYSLEEIKEPLLTEEEKEFLKLFKFETLQIDDHCLYFGLCVDDEMISGAFFKHKHKFNRLEIGRKYTREELGL